MTMTPYKIGFANLSQESQFALTVQHSLEHAVAQRDNVELLIRDNDLNDETALANARFFVEQKVNYVIFFHINERIGMNIQSILQTIPILTIDIPFPLAPHFGINNRQSGIILGDELARWIRTNWDGKADKVLALVDSRVLTLRDRSEYAVKTLLEQLDMTADDMFYLDCGNDFQTTLNNTSRIFNNWQEYNRIAAIGFNAESTFGLLKSAETVGCLDQLVVVGNAADHPLLEELQRDGTHVIAASYYDPANYGEDIMQLVDKVRNGERIQHRNFMDMELHKAPNPFTPA